MCSTKILQYGNQNIRRQAELTFFTSEKKHILEAEEGNLGMRGDGSRGEGV